MAAFTIEVRGLEQLVKRLDAPALLGPPLRRAFRVALDSLQTNVAKEAPVNRGTLKQSITSAIDAAPLPLWGKVGSNLDYAPHVEFGTKPHMPPLAPILSWVHDKGLGGRFKIAGGRRKLTARAPAEIELAIAQSVRWKIFRYGTPARHMFAKGLLAAQGAVEVAFRRAEAEIEAIWKAGRR